MLTIFLAVVAPLLLITGCNDSDANRQFANGPFPSAPVPTLVPTPTPTSLHQTSASPVQVNPATLLNGRGAPDRIYFLNGAKLWTIRGNGSDAHAVYAPAKGSRVRAFAASPTGDRVAVLVGTLAGKSESTSLLVLRADGGQLGRTDHLEKAFAGASSPIARSLDWSKQGDQLLATFDRGVLQISLMGKPTLLIGAAQAADPAGAAWSPAGDAVAFLSPVTPGQAAGLFVARTGAAPLDPVSVVKPNGSHGPSVARFAWQPAGDRILYVQGGAPAVGQAVTGGDIFAVSPAGQNKRLVVSAGSVGPVAQIVGFAPSPDGNAVAYTIYQRGDEPTFLRLSVTSLATGATLRLPVAPDQAVSDVWWTSSGLVWRTIAIASGGAGGYTGGAFALYRTDRNGNAVRIFEQAPATPVASPGASPVASPIASPVASPQASPAASPSAATPRP